MLHRNDAHVAYVLDRLGDLSERTVDVHRHSDPAGDLPLGTKVNRCWVAGRGRYPLCPRPGRAGSGYRAFGQAFRAQYARARARAQKPRGKGQPTSGSRTCASACDT